MDTIKKTGLKIFVRRYAHHFSAMAFVAGFVADGLTLPRVEFWATPYILGAYLLLALVSTMGSTLFSLASITSRFPNSSTYFSYLAQYAFGAILSALFIYYSRSATILGSWPFMIVLIGMIFLNERLHHTRWNTIFQFTTIFIALCLGAAFYVPLLFHTMSTAIFLLSGFVSILIMVFVVATTLLATKGGRKQIPKLIVSMTATYVLLLGSYFLGIIPPIPLSLKAAGVYHQISRSTDGSYLGFFEKTPPTLWATVRNPTYHLSEGKPLYFFSAIYAPVEMKTAVVHVWQHANNQTGEWETLHQVTFPILGGRNGGYRGYSVKENVPLGKWRVLVKTSQGALLGSETFVVISGSDSISLETKVL